MSDAHATAPSDGGAAALAAHPGDIAAIRALTDLKPHVALVLGSGLGVLAEQIDEVARIPFGELPGHPTTGGGVVGHAGEVVLGTLAGVPVVAFLGRVHRYQGLTARQAAWPTLLASELGARILLVTNAAGGLDTALSAGDVTLITDHINLTGDNPLVGWSGPEGGTPFVPLGDAYDAELQGVALQQAATLGLELHPVVYAGLLGPSYETPAEVEYLRRIGADTVGMSTVPEVIAARALGLRVLGLSLVTNVAGGAQLDHSEVLEAGRQAADAMSALVVGILGTLLTQE